MLQSPTSLKLVDSLAQIILALSQEEQHLLNRKIQVSESDLDSFFAELTSLLVDPTQPARDLLY